MCKLFFVSFSFILNIEKKRKKINLNMLNDEQRIFAEKNHALITYFMNKNKVPEDQYGILAIAYCNAVQFYNPESGAFSTYAFSAMRHILEVENKRNLIQRRVPQSLIISLNAPVKDTDGAVLEDIIPTKEKNIEDQVIEKMYIKDYLLSVDKKRREVLYMFLEGYTCKQISQVMGFSKQRADRIIKRFKEDYRNNKLFERKRRKVS